MTDPPAAIGRSFADLYARDEAQAGMAVLIRDEPDWKDTFELVTISFAGPAGTQSNN